MASPGVAQPADWPLRLFEALVLGLGQAIQRALGVSELCSDFWILIAQRNRKVRFAFSPSRSRKSRPSVLAISRITRRAKVNPQRGSLGSIHIGGRNE